MRRLRDYDICKCGDFRHQHAEGWRACEVCTEGDYMNGRKCLMFRLFEEVSWRRARRGAA